MLQRRPFKVNRRFEGTYRSHLQGPRIIQVRNQGESRWKSGFSVVSFFDPKDGCDMFRNFGWLSTDYTAFYMAGVLVSRHVLTIAITFIDCSSYSLVEQLPGEGQYTKLTTHILPRPLPPIELVTEHIPSAMTEPTSATDYADPLRSLKHELLVSCLCTSLMRSPAEDKHGSSCNYISCIICTVRDTL
jgi:hypothetical protein